MTYGKPHRPAYAFAERQLALQLPGEFRERAKDAARGLPHGMTIYAIGDNPTSDIRGANAAGERWRSVLVRTGVFRSEAENDPVDAVSPLQRRIVTSGISGGGSLAAPLRDARRFPSTRGTPYRGLRVLRWV